MNTAQVIPKKSVLQNKLLFGSSGTTGHLWENLVIEKHQSPNWLKKRYKGSVIDAFWSVLSSPIS